jgi:Flp pilus assembly protein TadB
MGLILRKRSILAFAFWFLLPRSPKPEQHLQWTTKLIYRAIEEPLAMVGRGLSVGTNIVSALQMLADELVPIGILLLI